ACEAQGPGGGPTGPGEGEGEGEDPRRPGWFPPGVGEGEGEGEGEDPFVPVGDELPAPASRLPRLSHAQWEQTVRDLLHLPDDTDYAAGLRSDPNPGGSIFDDLGALRVDQTLWQGYQRVAEEIAATVASDPELVAELAPDLPMLSEAQRIDIFIRAQGR